MSSDQQPPAGGNTTNTVPGFVGVSFLFTIALGTYIVRIYNRVRPTFRLTAADYIISTALLCELIVLISCFSAVHFGLGHYNCYITPNAMVKILKCLFPVGLFGFWASSLARISIGSMLLRFEITYTWRVVLWVLIVIQVAMPIGSDIFQLLQCRPIRAMWETVPDAVCWSARKSQSYGYIYSGMGITSDLVFAIMPSFFLWSLNRPLMERMLMTVLMGLGVIAAVAGAMKVYHIHSWNPREDTLRDWVPLIWWYRVEEIGLIAAACAPFLKPSIERLLCRFGSKHFGFVAFGLNTIRSGPGGTGKAVMMASTSGHWTSGEQQSSQQTPGHAASMTTSSGSSHSNSGAKYHGGDCKEV
ncbi:hypothetical protein BGZ60DRAFT_426605 [Tricladium varicosporioides]|nr:hypothetical protein BGZ60DRAFT_426605 [Hymenoscyphus varicosporioides]